MASAARARDRTIAKLHHSRLEVAGVNGRLAELSLHLKEEKSQWSKERAGMLQSVEVEQYGDLAGSPVCGQISWEERKWVVGTSEDLRGKGLWGAEHFTVQV